jgi:hypothetical protein
MESFILTIILYFSDAAPFAERKQFASLEACEQARSLFEDTDPRILMRLMGRPENSPVPARVIAVCDSGVLAPDRRRPLVVR